MKTPLNELLDFLDTQEGVPNIRVLVNQLGLLEKERKVIANAYNSGTNFIFSQTAIGGDGYFELKFGKDELHP